MSAGLKKVAGIGLTAATSAGLGAAASIGEVVGTGFATAALAGLGARAGIGDKAGTELIATLAGGGALRSTGDGAMPGTIVVCVSGMGIGTWPSFPRLSGTAPLMGAGVLESMDVGADSAGA